MNEDFKDIDQMEKYFNNQLSEQETAAFEQRLQTDTEFAKEVELFQDMIMAADYEVEERTQTNVTAVHQKLQSENFFAEESSAKVVNLAERRKNRLTWWAAAASITLLIGAGIWWLQQPDLQDQLNTTYANTYQPETESLNRVLDELESFGLADPTKGQEDTLATALYAYERGNYENARQQLADYVMAYPDDLVGKLYLGLSQLQMSEYTKASQQLIPLTQNEDFEYQETAKWYLALAYTRFETETGRSNALKLFQQLANSNSAYRAEAAQYLKLYK